MSPTYALLVAYTMPVAWSCVGRAVCVAGRHGLRLSAACCFLRGRRRPPFYLDTSYDCPVPLKADGLSAQRPIIH